MMSEFGKLLRSYREKATDPESGRRLSQVRFGQLIGDELDDFGFTGGAVSYWESGKSAIRQNERDVLVAIIQGLYRCQGIATADEANQLLIAGGYRALDSEEIKKINTDWLTSGAVSASPIPSPRPKNWSRLQRYLPEELYKKVEIAPRNDRAGLCLPHLTQLLQTVTTYVPRQLAIDLLKDPFPPTAQNKGQFLTGTLLFADISGFTSLSETLHRKGGKEGAEEVARMVNRYLDTMLEIIFKHNGSLIKFGGDGMLCLFAGEDEGAVDAVFAAWDMKEMMAKKFAKMEVLQEVFMLDMKVGSHSGLLFAATAGNAEHMEYILTGAAVEYTAQTESVAQRGDIIISAQTYQQTAHYLTAEPLPNQPEFYRLLGVKKKKILNQRDFWLKINKHLTALTDDLWGIIDRLDALTPYLPTGVLPYLVYDPLQASIDGQHRQITILFANFTGMSAIIDAYGVDDPAGIAAELNTFFCAMQEEVAYYGSAVNKVDLYDQGDKLMIVFGAPIAHERDARRAALTALAMQQAMNTLSTPLASSLIRQCIGIHSGYAFAGNVGSVKNNRREYTVMGDTVNLAARLMTAAPPNEIWISQQTWAQIEADFEAQTLPALTLKGIDEPVTAYRLTAHTSLVRQRIPRDLRSEIVGREAEIDALLHHFDELIFGAGKQILALTGEGGVGKTRLIQEWQQKAEHVTGGRQSTKWLFGNGRSFGQRAHGIFIDLLESLLSIEADNPQAIRLKKLSDYLLPNFVGQTHWQDLFSDKLAYLGYFLGIDLSQREGLTERVTQLEAEPLHLQIQLALCDLLTETARKHPLILIMEDLHWADQASLDMLRFIIDRMSDDVPILFCLVFRPQRQHPIWQIWYDLERSYPDFCQHLPLPELRNGDGRTLLLNLLQSSQLPPEFLATVLEATDGNPLYIEEVLHSLIEDGTLVSTENGWQLMQNRNEIDVPDTLYQIIQSRIDDLDFSSPGVRRVLWLSAVLGISFSEDLLRQMFLETGRSEDEYMRHCRALRNADMLQRVRIQSGENISPGFRFRHGLVRQVAYENMLVSKRCDYHIQVANWLEKTFADSLGLHFDALAYHYDQGRQWTKAFSYHCQVGKRDASTFANESAAFHLNRALQIAPSATPPPLAIDMSQVHFELGKVLVLKGDYEDGLTRLQQTCESLKGNSEASAILMYANACYEIGRIYENWGGGDNLQTSLLWQEKGLAVLPDYPTASASRLYALSGIVYLRQGEFERCIAAGDEALKIARAANAKTEIGFAHRLLSLAARHQGRLQDAINHSQQSLAIFEETADLIGMGREYANQGVFTFEQDDWALAQTFYKKAVETLEQVGDQYRLAMACNNLADLYAHLGDPDQGIPYAERGLEIFIRLQSHQGTVFAQTVLASLYWRKRDWLAARAAVEQAGMIVETQDIALFRPMVGRWSVQVSMASGDLISADKETHSLLALGVEFLADEAEPIQRLRGQLLAAQGKESEAIEVLEASLSRLEAAQMRYQTGLTQLALAQVFAQIDKIYKARTQAEQAHIIFSELGAKLDLQEAKAFLASLG
jgi:class 3 adenylate cyclase/tetratricopeptide (TPR) repeat protein